MPPAAAEPDAANAKAEAERVAGAGAAAAAAGDAGAAVATAAAVAVPSGAAGAADAGGTAGDAGGAGFAAAAAADAGAAAGAEVPSSAPRSEYSDQADSGSLFGGAGTEAGSAGRGRGPQLSPMDPDLVSSVLADPGLSTLRLIPKRGRKVAAEVLGMLAGDLTERALAGEETGAPFAAAWKMFLAGNPSVSAIHVRAGLIREGRWGDLKANVMETCPPSKRRRGHDSRRSAKAAATAGNIGKALRTLSVKPRAGAVPPARHRALLVEKHPPNQVPLPQPPAYQQGTMSSIRALVEEEADRRREGEGPPDRLAWESFVRKEIFNLRTGTSPGPSGMRPEHLRLAMGEAGSQTAFNVADLVDLMLGGLVPSSLATAGLVGIPKEDGGLRPIAYGEVLRKVAARMTLAAMRGPLSARLEDSGQLGLAKYGPFRVFAAARDAVRNRKYVFKIDCKNAFNSVERAAATEATAQAVSAIYEDSPNGRPDLGLPFVQALHSQPTKLYFTGERLEPLVNFRGVDQGCPLSPLVFALVCQRQVDRVKADGASDTLAGGHGIQGVSAVFLHDDGYVMGEDPAAVATFLKLLDVRFAEVGISLNPLKSQYLSPIDADSPQLAVWGQRADFTRVVGGPLTAVYVEATARVGLVEKFASDVIQEKAAEVTAAALFEDPQHAWGALRFCGMYSRTNFLFVMLGLEESLPVERRLKLMALAEGADMVAFAESLGAYGAELGPKEWIQATLAITQGGVGIASLTANLPSIEHMTNAAAERARPGVDWTAFGKATEGAKAEKLNQPRNALLALRQICSPAENARLSDLGSEGAGAWIRACPMASLARGTLMEPTEAQAAMALHLGMPVLAKYDGQGPRPCPRGDSCRTRGWLEPNGRHTLQCTHVYRRHNLVRDTMASLAGPVALPGSLAIEQGLGSQEGQGQPGGPHPGSAPEAEADRSRPADIKFRLNGARDTYVDVTVTGIRQGDNGQTRIALRAEQEKVAHFDRRFRSNGNATGVGTHFVPFAVSTFGTFGPSANKEISRLAKEYDARGVEIHADPQFSVAECMKQRLATAVVSANGGTIRNARVQNDCRDVSWEQLPPRAVAEIGTRHACEAESYRRQARDAAEKNRLLPVWGSSLGVQGDRCLDLSSGKASWGIEPEFNNEYHKCSIKTLNSAVVRTVELTSKGPRRRFVGNVGGWPSRPSAVPAAAIIPGG